MRLYIFLVHLPYSINKEVIIHVFYHRWHQHFIIWVTNMHHNISSGVSKHVFWKFIIKIGCTSAVILLWDITKEKTKKDSIIILRNGIHPRHMIYFGISLLVQLCVCYQTRGTGLIIVLQFEVNVCLIPILKWHFHSHRIP